MHPFTPFFYLAIHECCFTLQLLSWRLLEVCLEGTRFYLAFFPFKAHLNLYRIVIIAGSLFFFFGADHKKFGFARYLS
jgi:hypothetical protein